MSHVGFGHYCADVMQTATIFSLNLSASRFLTVVVMLSVGVG